jgi:hypothetical protein
MYLYIWPSEPLLLLNCVLLWAPWSWWTSVCWTWAIFHKPFAIMIRVSSDRKWIHLVQFISYSEWVASVDHLPHLVPCWQQSCPTTLPRLLSLLDVSFSPSVYLIFRFLTLISRYYHCQDLIDFNQYVICSLAFSPPHRLNRNGGSRC